MSNPQNKLENFWKELKRRKVVKVIILYATTAFILLQALSLVIDPLNLPKWVMTLVIVLLVIGFPIAIIFSWIFDVTPSGIEITVASHKKTESETLLGSKKKRILTNLIMTILVIIVGVLVYPKVFSETPVSKINPELEKSIAVIPFINDSSDKENTYVINGMMESILNNLSKINDLKVISRTSVEKYRENPKLISEIAEELGVSYIVEGSGQKSGNQIMLTIQLIEAKTDTHLWSNQYIRDDKDILNLQIEVAKAITDQIQVIITPEEAKRIAKVPSENLEAYDLYLKGRSVLEEGSRRLELKTANEALKYFEKAVKIDPKFSMAYSSMAYVYSRMADNNKDSEYVPFINKNADLALINNPELDLAFIAKGIYYQILNEYDLAILFYKKALEYNPNSNIAIRYLRFIYFTFKPDSEQQLIYALKAIKINIEEGDTLQVAYNDFGLSIAFRTNGFFKEAEKYMDKASKYIKNSKMFTQEKTELLLDSGQPYEKAQALLLEVHKRDSLSTQTLRFLYQNYYLMRDYNQSYNFLMKLLKIDNDNRSGYLHDIRMAIVFEKTGHPDMAEIYFKRFDVGLDNIKSYQKWRMLSVYYAYKGDAKKTVEQMELFLREDNYAYWTIRFFKDDPVYDNIRNLPEFKTILSKIEAKFWKNHDRIKASLEEKGLL